MKNNKPWLNHLSYSALNLYNNCPRCFYLQYGLKIWEEEKSEGLLFGGELHDQIAGYHGYRKPAWKKRLDGVRPEEIQREVKPYLKLYKEMYPKESEGVETEFLIDFRHPDTGQSLGVPIKGIMDRIHAGHLFEHKTSSARYTKRWARDMKQLTLYSYAFRQLFGKKEKSIKINVFLRRKGPKTRNLEVIETARDNSDYADFWYWARPLVVGIMRGHFGRREYPQDYWFKHLDVCA